MERKKYVGVLKSRIELIGVDETFSIVHGGQGIRYMNRMVPFADKLLLVEKQDNESIYWFGIWKIHPAWIKIISARDSNGMPVNEVTVPNEEVYLDD